jgi:CheY-like chemotaxis protein
MVEDEQAVREVGARFLAQLGYVVHQAGDVETALQLLAAHPEIRLVFTDIVLPGSRGGIELAADVRRLRPDIALLFTSGYASGAVDGLENLPGRLLDKPYQRKTLAQPALAGRELRDDRRDFRRQGPERLRALQRGHGAQRRAGGRVGTQGGDRLHRHG